MANLEELAWSVRNDGYSEVNAEAKVCQDIVLKAISTSSLSRNVTIKGGVVMRSITGSSRRATQDEYCFDVCLDDVGASLLINSKEQIFTEKLRSLLRFGPLSTRYKDIFDLCYLSDYVDKDRLVKCLNTYIFDDPGMRENDMIAVMKRVNRTFSDKLYRQNIGRSTRLNWLGIKVDDAFKKITGFLETL